jgi:outer membrane immunogenic protein
MRKLALAGFVLIASIVSASAADLPTHKDPPPADPLPVAYDWTGFYAGLNAGGAWGRSDPNTTIGCPATGYFCTPAFFTANGPQIAGLASGSKNSSGFTGGAQVGYNWQAGNLVYGLEGDLGAFHLQGSTGGTALYSTGAPGRSFNVGTSYQTDWLATARGRLGWALSNFLLYGTGGLAVTELKVSNSFTDNIVVPGASGAFESASENAVRVGWTVGAGAEWALSSHWAIKVEYLYADFGGRVAATGTVVNPGAVYAGRTNPIATSANITAQIARVGVDYKF